MKFLIIQTAFIGDVILATAVAEKLHRHYPDAQIDFMLRKGNEGLLVNHPFIKNIFVWDKKNKKIKNLISITQQIRKQQYDAVFNLHRFSSSGFVTAFSGAKNKIGFDKNPLSFLFTKKIKHEIGNGKHETERNQLIIESFTDNKVAQPKLYPTTENIDSVKKYQTSSYCCIAPTSVWFTKQFSKEQWVQLCDAIEPHTHIYLLGAPADATACDWIIKNTKHQHITNLAGKLNFLESAALMKNARMNYVNDSAPMHIASAMNAKTTAIYCSTIPAFGFGPLSDNSKIVETKEQLSCRPCGLHGHKACPQGHFKCSTGISIKDILN